MSAIYGVHDPDEKLEMFDTMLFDCMERHVPWKGTKIIRPLTLWLKYKNIRFFSVLERCNYTLGRTCP